jgi:hypothetical protein
VAREGEPAPDFTLTSDEGEHDRPATFRPETASSTSGLSCHDTPDAEEGGMLKAHKHGPTPERCDLRSAANHRGQAEGRAGTRFSSLENTA